MIRPLLIIAGAGLVLATASLGGAFALGGRDMARNGWSWTFDTDEHGNTSVIRRAGPAEDLGPDTVRTVAFTGGEGLELELSADVTYVQGPAATVVITGPKTVVDRVRVEGGRLSLEDGTDRLTLAMEHGGLRAWADSERLKIVVTAPGVRRFDIEGSSDLSIRNYDQDEMSLDISGSGEVTATGRTRILTLDISGSGEAHLGGLETTDAEVDISGSGEARIAPTGAANVSISGSGDVDLATRPTTLRQNISGSGEVDELG